jgi:hypothetical protein
MMRGKKTCWAILLLLNPRPELSSLFKISHLKETNDRGKEALILMHMHTTAFDVIALSTLDS